METLAHSSLTFKRAVMPESSIVIWRCPRSLDLVAEKLEDHFAFNTLLNMVRRLCGTWYHASGRATLAALGTLSSLDSTLAAPQLCTTHRIVPSVTPQIAGAICNSYVETHTYVYSLLRCRPDGQLYKWAMRTRDQLMPLTSWLLLAPVADLLSILRIDHVKLQRRNLRVRMAQLTFETRDQQLDERVSLGGQLRSALALLG